MAIVKIIRWQNLLMVLLTLLLTKYCMVDLLVDQSVLTTPLFILLAIAIVCITAGGYIANDIIDVNTDLINKPSKVVIGHTISVSTAWKLYTLLTLTGVTLGVYLSFSIQEPIFSLFFIGPATMLLLYSFLLKRILLVGNITIGVLVALVPVLVFVFGQESLDIIDETKKTLNQLFNQIALMTMISVYAFFSFLITVLRELVKDIEDIDGDYNQQMKTLPIVIGRNRTKIFVFILALVMFTFIIMVIKTYLLQNLYVALYTICGILLPLVYFIIQLKGASSKEDFSHLSTLLKVIMLTGICSMFFLKLI